MYVCMYIAIKNPYVYMIYIYIDIYVKKKSKIWILQSRRAARAWPRLQLAVRERRGFKCCKDVGYGFRDTWLLRWAVRDRVLAINSRVCASREF